MEEVYEFIKKCGTYFLATIDGDQPRIRPFGTIHIFEGKLYIQTGLSKPVARQIMAGEKVALCSFNGQEWVRVAATAVYDDRMEAQDSMFSEYPKLRAMYTPGDGNTAVFYLKDAQAIFCSYKTSPRIVTF